MKAHGMGKMPPSFATGSDAVDTELSEQQEETASRDRGHYGPTTDDLRRMIEETVDSKMGNLISKMRDEFADILGRSSSSSQVPLTQDREKGLLGFHSGEASDMMEKAEKAYQESRDKSADSNPDLVITNQPSATNLQAELEDKKTKSAFGHTASDIMDASSLSEEQKAAILAVMTSEDPSEEDAAVIRRINLGKLSASDRVSLRKLVTKHSKT